MGGPQWWAVVYVVMNLVVVTEPLRCVDQLGAFFVLKMFRAFGFLDRFVFVLSKRACEGVLCLTVVRYCICGL